MYDIICRPLGPNVGIVLHLELQGHDTEEINAWKPGVHAFSFFFLILGYNPYIALYNHYPKPKTLNTCFLDPDYLAYRVFIGSAKKCNKKIYIYIYMEPRIKGLTSDPCHFST